MKKLMIALVFLPAGLNAMNYNPYLDLGTIESIRTITQNQIEDLKFQAEMAARQVHAANQIALAIAAENQAAQTAQTAAQPAPESGLVPRPTEVPIYVKDINGGKDHPFIQQRQYADRTENEMRDGRTQIYYDWMLCGQGSAPKIVRYAGKPQFQSGTFRGTPTRVITNPSGQVEKVYADGRSELEDSYGTIVRFWPDGRKAKIKYDEDGECVILREMK